jgi:tetratricopeptide (TPR) repeat protein
MVKLVILKLKGDFQQGFQVTLEIGEDGQVPDLKMDSVLPKNCELAHQAREHWEENYRHLGHSSRIKRPQVVYGGHINRQIQKCQTSAQRLEETFNQWLRDESFHNLREEWLAGIPSAEEVRVLVQSIDPLIQKLPWHRWDLLNRYPQAEIALSAENFKRQKSRSILPKEKVKILAIFGSSEGIDIQTDRQLLEDLSDRAEIQIFVEPQRQDINDQLWEQHWDMIFFAGHSETDGNEGRIYLNTEDSLTIHELWYGLRKAVENGLQLAIFNSCDGLGLARSLNDILIPQTIVMRERVPDVVAQHFLRYFLQAFSRGKSLYLSVREARERLQGLEHQFPCATWLPVIYQNPGEIPLFWEDYLGQLENCKPDQSSDNVYIHLIPKYRLALVSVLILGCGLLAYPFSLNLIGIYFNQVGVKNIAEKRYDRALFYLHTALKLGANKPKILNNLGYLYERMGELDLAQVQFRQAKLLGDPFGCNNEAFLYIQDREYQRADEQLRVCLGQMKQSQSQLGEYVVRKNLGWALLMKPGSLKLGDYTEAEKHLNDAIELYQDGGTANCVLAQVLEKQNRNSEALKHWQSCSQYVPDDRSPESEWKKQAQYRLQESKIR